MNTFKEPLDLNPTLLEEFRNMALNLHSNHTNVGSTLRMEEWKNCKMTFCQRRYKLAYPELSLIIPEPIILPIPMVLFCPSCHEQHVDLPETDEQYAANVAEMERPVERWMNPPHKSHLCLYCGTEWRPADICTTGVQTIRHKRRT